MAKSRYYFIGILLGLLFCSFATAQYSIQIDLSNKSYKLQSFNKDGKQTTFELVNCGSYKKTFVFIEIPSKTNKTDTFEICKKTIIEKDDLFKTDDTEANTEVLIEAKIGKKKVEIVAFALNLKGDIKDVVTVETPRISFLENPKTSPLLNRSTTDFVPATFYIIQPRNNNLSPNQCLVTYYPSTNEYIVNGSPSESFIRYAKDLSWLENQIACDGVIFRIINFNVSRYNVTVNNSFSTMTESTPSTVLEFIAPLITSSSLATPFSTSDNENADDKIKMEALDSLSTAFGDIVTINTQLQNYFQFRIESTSYIDLEQFDRERAQIIDNIETRFPQSSGINIVSTYQGYRNEYIRLDSLSVTAFNKQFKEKYKLDTIPDAIVQKTQLLIQKLVSIDLVYQYNVPQIQNSDLLEFQISMSPKDDNYGGIHLNQQSLEIPITGGVKIDFSSGLYFSSISSKKFEFEETYEGDNIVSKTIVEENGSSGGALGIAALAHFYPRMNKFSAGITLGAGASNKLNYSLLCGGSLVFGKKKRAMLSGGFNFSEVRELSSTQKVGMKLPESASLKTNNRIRQGYFLAFTYNFGTNTAIQIVQESDGDNSMSSSNNSSSEEKESSEENEQKKS
ncbi:MAG: hypothetical protein AAGG68_22160 [Bacteroidota bacterium]